MPKQGYSKFLVASAEIRTGFHLVNTGEENVSDQFFQRGVESLLEAIRTGDHPYSPDALLDNVLALTRSFISSDRGADLVDALEAGDPVFPEWGLELARGMVWRKKAWEERGAGFAPEVSRRGWRGFEAAMLEARRHFERAYALAPHDQRPGTAMIEIAMVGHAREVQTERLWFDRAVAARFDYIPAYIEYAWSLRSRWGGDPDQLIELGVECAETNRFDTPVPGLLISLLSDASDDLAGFDPAHAWTRPGVAELVYRVIDGLLADPRRERDRARLRTIYATVAWLNGDTERSAATVRDLGAEFDSEAVWSTNSGATPERVREDAVLLTSPHAKKIRQADAALEAGRADEAVTILAAVSDDADGADGAGEASAGFSPALHQRIAAAGMAQNLASGEWFDILFDERISGFRNLAGRWRRVDERTIAGSPWIRPGGDYRLALVSEILTNNRYELQATFNLNELKTPVRSGDILTHASRSPLDYRTVGAYPGINVFYARRQSLAATRRSHEFDPEAPVTIRVKVWDDLVVVFLNGERVYHGPYDGGDFGKFGSRFGFGAFTGPNTVGTIVISGVRMRGLSETPAEFVRLPF